MMKKLKGNRAFTLIELIVVIAVLGILVLLAAPRFLGYTEQAREAQIKNDVKTYENIIQAERINDDEFIENNTGGTIESDVLEDYQKEGSLFDREGQVTDSEEFNDEYFIIDEKLANTDLEGDFILSEGGKVYYYDENITGGNNGDGNETEEPDEPEVERVRIKDFIATQSDRVLVVLEDNTVSGWGFGFDDGFDSAYGVNQSGAEISQMSGGLTHNVILRADGSVETSYLSDYDANDTGNTWRKHVTDTPTTSDFTQVAAGAYFTVALKEDGSIHTWGFGEQAAFPGDDEIGLVKAETPTENDFTMVDAGPDHAIALRDDGTIEVWGVSSSDRNNMLADKPTDGGYIGISAGGNHNVAWKADGTVVAWGNNSHGQTEQPELPAGETIATVSAGNKFNAALTNENTLVTWGDLEFSGMWEPEGGVIPPPNGEKFVEISAGSMHGVAMKADGELVTWGYNYGTTIVDDTPYTIK